MEESKKKLKELEDWICAYKEPIDRICVYDIFYEIKEEIEYWRAMYDGCLKECEDIANYKNKEINHLHKQMNELRSEISTLNSIKREGN